MSQKINSAPFKFSGMFELNNNYMIFGDVCTYVGESEDGFFFRDSAGTNVFSVHADNAHLPKTVGTFEVGKSYKVDGKIVQYVGVGKTSKDEWCHNFVSHFALGETTVSVLLAHYSKVDVVYGTCFVDLTPLGDFCWNNFVSQDEDKVKEIYEYVWKRKFQLLQGEQVELFRNYLRNIGLSFASVLNEEGLQAFFVQEVARRVMEHSHSGFLSDISKDGGIFVQGGVWYFEIL